MNLSSLGPKFKQKFELLQNLELQSFELTMSYCTYFKNILSVVSSSC
jgi:hypothetical protein